MTTEDLWRSRAEVLYEVAAAATRLVSVPFEIVEGGAVMVNQKNYEKLVAAVETLRQASTVEDISNGTNHAPPGLYARQIETAQPPHANAPRALGRGKAKAIAYN